MNILAVIARAKKGDSLAERTLFDLYAGKVFTICKRYTRSDHQAKDWMQECFILIFDKLDSYDSERGDFGGWVHQLSRNCILHHLRKNRSRFALTFPEELPEVIEDTKLSSFEEIRDEDLVECIRHLPDGFREILNLYVFEGLTHQEIAHHLGITAGTSRSQYSRAKLLLKQTIIKKIGLQYERF